MVENKPTQEQLITEIMALRADLIGLLIQTERILEINGQPVNPAVISRGARHSRRGYIDKKNGNR